MTTGRYHWSNAAHPARFFVINAAASVPFLALALHPSWTGFYVALGVVAFLAWVEKMMKMTLTAFFRSLNIVVTGRVKSSLNLFKELSR